MYQSASQNPMYWYSICLSWDETYQLKQVKGYHEISLIWNAFMKVIAFLRKFTSYSNYKYIKPLYAFMAWDRCFIFYLSRHCSLHVW